MSQIRSRMGEPAAAELEMALFRELQSRVAEKQYRSLFCREA